MPGPIDSLRFVHAAIITEVRRIEGAVYAATTADELRALAEAVEWFDQLIHYHTKGEEVGLFPALAERAPHIDEPYVFDHGRERELIAELRAAIAGGELAMARRVATALAEHTIGHVHKENELVLPFVASTFSPAEQGQIVQKIVGTIPPEKMSLAVPWLVERMPIEMAEGYVRGMMAGMPPPVFAQAKAWIRGGVSPELWQQISARVPELVA